MLDKMDIKKNLPKPPTTHLEDNFKILQEKIWVTRRKPRNLQADHLSYFAHEFQREIMSSHVWLLRGVWVVNGFVFNVRKCRLYASYTFPTKWVSWFKSLALQVYRFGKAMCTIIFILKKGVRLEQGIWITDHRSWQYFHWFTEALPRLINTRDLVDEHTLILPENYRSIPYVADSLAAFNIRMRFIKPSERLLVQELLLPSHTGGPGNYHGKLIDQIRTNILSHYNKENRTPYRKIYISRQKALRRKILNEVSVEEILLSHGFEIHHFEEYSFERQVAIASEAKAIVAVHGAGLTNMLFMRKGGQILELRNHYDHHNNCYFSLASELGHDYFYLLNKATGKRTYSADLLVNIYNLAQSLHLMGLKDPKNQREGGYDAN